MGENIILCPFWRQWRAHFGSQFCDNLVQGIPQCVASKFYPDDPHYFENIEDYYNIKICGHFVWTDFYREGLVKRKCLFGGEKCFHSDDPGFGACVGCSRFETSH